MVSPRKAPWAVLFLAGLTLLLSSCYTAFSRMDVTLPRDFEVPALRPGEKIPLRAGLYLSERTRTYRPLREPGRQGDTYIGEAISAGSKMMLQNIFREIVLIDASETDSRTIAAKCDVLVSPEVISVAKRGALDSPIPYGADYVAETVIKWNIGSPDGKVIYFATVTGESVTKASITYSHETRAKELREVYLRSLVDNLYKAQEDIFTSAWWKTPWWMK